MPTPSTFNNPSLLLPWNEIVEQGGNIYQQAARQVRDFACRLHRQAPSQLTGNCQFLDNPLCRWNHSRWDNVCGGEQSGIKRFKIFGGQCTATYRIEYQKALIQDGTFQNWYGAFQTGFIDGPIQSFEMTVGGSTIPDPYVGHWQFRGQYIDTGPFNGGGYQFIANGVIAANIGGSGNRLVRFVRTDGQPDNCGDGDESFEYPADNPLSDEDKTTNITINNSDNTTFVIPLTFIDASQTDFNVNFFLGDLTIPNGGVGVQIDQNGVSFNGEGGTLDAGDFPKGDTCKPKKPSFPDLEEEPGQEEEEDDNIEYVKINLTTFPDRASYGNSEDETNFFAGFLKWNIDGKGYTVPQYIMNKDSVFEAPENTKGYIVTFRNGARGIVTKFKVKSEEETT